MSVITVVFNDAANIERTVKSVVGQKSDKFEFIVVDGNSDDDTYEILKNYEGKIDALISEPDQGLYDAMNKGLSLARGKWIYFLNSNDTFMSPDVISTVIPKLQTTSDFVHFNCRVIDRLGNSIPVRKYPEAASELRDWPCVQHQSVFSTKDRLDQHGGFETQLKILADYNFFCSAYQAGADFEFHENIYVANYNSEGLSASARAISRVMSELKSIQKMHFGRYNRLIQLQLTAKLLLSKMPFGTSITHFLRRSFLAHR